MYHVETGRENQLKVLMWGFYTVYYLCVDTIKSLLKDIQTLRL